MRPFSLCGKIYEKGSLKRKYDLFSRSMYNHVHCSKLEKLHLPANHVNAKCTLFKFDSQVI